MKKSQKDRFESLPEVAKNLVQEIQELDARVRDLEVALNLNWEQERILVLAIEKIRGCYPSMISEEDLRLYLGIKSATVWEQVVDRLLSYGFERFKKNRRPHIVEQLRKS